MMFGLGRRANRTGYFYLNSQIKLYSMFKEENYDQVFSHRVDRQNIQIIKKFFVFQPTSTNSLKPAANCADPQGNDTVQLKKNHKFPAGFWPQNKGPEHPLLEEQETPMLVQSKKAPTNQLNSFLLGLTNRINQEAGERITEQERKISKTSPDRRIKYDEVISNLTRIRRQSRLKFGSYHARTSHTTKNNSESITSDVRESQLPILEKKVSSNTKKSSSTISHNYTPLLQNHRSELIDDSKQGDDQQLDKEVQHSCASQRKSNSYRSRFNGKRSIINTAKISSKLIKLAEQPAFMKGYLGYDPPAKQFLQKNQININQSVQVSKPVHITAANYIVINRHNLKVISEKKSEQEIEIASLTKIMTCYLCILVCRKYKVNPADVSVRVSDRAAEMPGTSAELQAGDIVTLNDLLYGLMLPSGNDASVAVAETAGKIIQRHKKKQTKKTYYDTFIAHMNILARQIKTQQNYQNSSGLSLNPNNSTAKAITLLTAIAMQNKTFFDVINTKEYEVQIKNQRFGLIRKQVWKNTNKLLWKGWQGVKTGTTETAGHCLMSCKGDLLISVFNCETLGKRFSECIKLYDAFNGENIS